MEGYIDLMKELMKWIVLERACYKAKYDLVPNPDDIAAGKDPEPWPLTKKLMGEIGKLEDCIQKSQISQREIRAELFRLQKT